MGILSALTVTYVLNTPFVLSQPEAETSIFRSNKCSKLVPGTYLTTILDANGNFASRGVITLTKEGNLFVTDSNQGGVSGAFNPFGDTQGSYRCIEKKAISATGINFGFSGNNGVNDIARSDIKAILNPITQTLQGTITVRSFALKANPLQEEGVLVGTFSFTGQRINAH
ncbi:hypothetical protein LC607_05020 [Nostoc sp. CHAB 5824]|nr:hypothetical protein [Nostoc sp. CHAB 5824]